MTGCRMRTKHGPCDPDVQIPLSYGNQRLSIGADLLASPSAHIAIPMVPGGDLRSNDATEQHNGHHNDVWRALLETKSHTERGQTSPPFLPQAVGVVTYGMMETAASCQEGVPDASMRNHEVLGQRPQNGADCSHPESNFCGHCCWRPEHEMISADHRSGQFQPVYRIEPCDALHAALLGHPHNTGSNSKRIVHWNHGRL